MAERALSAHPMLEPADYDLTPELAQREGIAGELLVAYTLLWHAAVATLQDGPAITRETLTLGFKPRLLADQGFSCEASIRYDLVDDPGWASGVLAAELHRLAPEQRSTPTSAVHDRIQAVPAVLVDGGWQVRGSSALAGVAAQLPTPAKSLFQVLQVHPEKLRIDTLLEQMAANSVGRPSTFASVVTKATASGLITEGADGLGVGCRGAELLDLLGDAQASFGALACRSLGEDLEDVASGGADAGDVLRRHCESTLGMKPALADWLDQLEIDGETLNDAVARIADKLPDADGWSRVDLPDGIRPELQVADQARALALRDELDTVLAGAGPAAWRAAGARGRALTRLAAMGWLGFAQKSHMPGGLMRLLTRDLVVRWWVDLAPTDRTPSAAEFDEFDNDRPESFAEWLKGRPGFLDELLEALG